MKRDYPARETPRQRKIWYGLALAGSSGAAFDAWSTTVRFPALRAGGGIRSCRPLQTQKTIYAATQVSPAVLATWASG